MPSPDITPEVLRRSTARRVVVMLALAVLFFVLINLGARTYLESHGTNLGYRVIHNQWTLLDEMEAPVDWLILGDSSGVHGVVPEVFAEGVGGGTAVNLSTLANCLVVDDAWMLHRYIERFGAPKQVVLVHAHDVWHRGYNSTLIGQIPRPWGHWARTPPTLDLTVEQEAKIFLNRFVPVYARRDTLKAHLAAWGPPRDLTFEPTPSGWLPSRPHRAASFARDVARTRRFLRKNRFRMSKHNRRALEVIGGLSDEHGFDVYLVNGPMAAQVAGDDDFVRYQRDKVARLRSMMRAHRRVVVVSAQSTHAAERMEVAVDHVIPDEAPRYTRFIADVIRRQRAGGG